MPISRPPSPTIICRSCPLLATAIDFASGDGCRSLQTVANFDPGRRPRGSSASRMTGTRIAAGSRQIERSIRWRATSTTPSRCHTNKDPFTDNQRPPGAEIRHQPRGAGRQDPVRLRRRRQRPSHRSRPALLQQRTGADDRTIPTRPSSTSRRPGSTASRSSCPPPTRLPGRGRRRPAVPELGQGGGDRPHGEARAE
jgi:hypothetical protein